MDGLGFSVLGEFEDHEGFDGIILGRPGAPYHLEFTTNRSAASSVTTSDEHLLVFYYPDQGEWAATCLRMARAGFRSAKSANPYWDLTGNTFVDADGSRVVIQNGTWPDG
jgi:prolyl oligopeptidase